MTDLPSTSHWSSTNLAAGTYTFPVGTVAFEIWGIAGGGGGGGNGHCNLILHNHTAWGGGGASGAYTHIKCTNVLSSSLQPTITLSGNLSGGSGGSSSNGSGTQAGSDGISASDLTFTVEVQRQGTYTEEYFAHTFIVHGGGCGGGGQAGPDGVDHWGAAGVAGTGQSWINGVRETTFNGNGGAAGRDGHYGEAGVTDAGERTYDINSDYKLNLNNYGSGGDGSHDNEGNEAGYTGTAGIVTLVYCVEFTASATVSPNDMGTATVSKSSGIEPNEVVTFTATPASGCTFLKWSDDSTDLVHNVTVTSNTALTAYFGKWVTITLIPYDGATPITHTWVARSTQVLDTPTREHFTFKGWENSSGELVDKDNYYVPDEDTTLYGRWEAQTPITFDENYIYPTAPVNTLYFEKGTVQDLTNITDPSGNPIPTSRAAYSFLGWMDSTGTLITRTAYTIPNEAATLTAKWSDLLMDSWPFVIVFDAGGGSFDSSKPPVVTSDGTTSIGTIEYYKDGTQWVWGYNSPSTLETTIKVNLVNMVSGLTVPSGMASVKSFDIQAPFTTIYEAGSTSNYTVKLKRITQDNMCHYTAYPLWVPGRGDTHRCIITSPQFGSLDFGQIQSITETYSASLTTIPVVCYGYSGAFCMDLGVTKKLNVNYLRVNPMVVDETSLDSRHWSNAHWIKVFKEFTDRWQMRTNGCLLYLKRPDNDRLGPEYVTDDPVYEYYPEIEGENTYISSAPVKYDTKSSQRIQNSVTFTVGTIYPRAPPEDMVKVTYKWSNSTTTNPDIDLYYPRGVYVPLPEKFASWNNIPSSNPTSLIVWAGWQDPAGSGNILQPRALVKFDTDSTVTAYTVSISGASIIVMDPKTASTYSFTYSLKRTDITKASYIYISAIGGGGGGGKRSGAFHPIEANSSGGGAAGGGGSSGVVLSAVYSIIDPTLSVRTTVGKGGSVTDGQGNDGENTIFYMGNQIMGVALGGKAGGAATLSGTTATGGAGGTYVEQTSVNAGGKGGDRISNDPPSSPSYVLQKGSNGAGPNYGSGGDFTLWQISETYTWTYSFSGAGGGGGPAAIIDEYNGVSYVGHGGFQQKSASGDDCILPSRGGGGAGGYYYAHDQEVDEKDPQAGGDGIAVLYLVNLEVV